MIYLFGIKLSPSISRKRNKEMFLTHFVPMISFNTPWKDQKISGFSDVFRGCQKRTVAWNGLKRNNSPYVNNRTTSGFSSIIRKLSNGYITGQKMRFSIKDFFSKFFIENFIFFNVFRFMMSHKFILYHTRTTLIWHIQLLAL